LVSEKIAAERRRKEQEREELIRKEIEAANQEKRR
jgi:hypothetical protein